MRAYAFLLAVVLLLPSGMAFVVGCGDRDDDEATDEAVTDVVDTGMDMTTEPMDTGTTDMTTDMTTGTTEPPPAEYPQFPWPPPEASATHVIPRNLLLSRSSRTLLRDVNQRIVAVLERNGYWETSYFAVPDGFALVTRIEQIDQEGNSKPDPPRWSLAPPRLENFSLRSYLTALFRAQPGYYRIVVFVVSPHPFAQADVEVSADEARHWLSEGLNQLPEPIGLRDFSRSGYACTALIYQFERPTESDEPTLRVPSSVSGRTHLQKAGVLGALGS